MTTAALVATVGGGVFAATQSPTSSSSAPPASTMTWQATNTVTGVSATAELSSFDWGTRIDAAIDSMRTGQICVIRVIDRDDRAWDAGSWRVGDRTENLRWSGDVGVPMDRVASVEIWDATADRRLITLSS